MGSETKQEEILSGSFYILENPESSKGALVCGLLAGENLGFGSFLTYDLKERKHLGPSVPLNLSLDAAQPLILSSKSFNCSGLEDYKKSFHQVSQAIEKGDLVKAVLYKTMSCRTGFVERGVFLNAVRQTLKTKKSGFLFAFYDEENKRAVLGLSPEYLFASKNGRLMTTAVAGTLPSESKELWSQKLFNEHRDVMRGISGVLSGLEWSQVFEKKIGGLKHLVAEAYIETNLDSFSLAKRLHPTPAVGTLPKEKFLDYILGPDFRGYYGGFVQVQDFSLVCIRHFEWSGEELQVCIGGGVIKESAIRDEWAELSLKWSSFCKTWGIN